MSEVVALIQLLSTGGATINKKIMFLAASLTCLGVVLQQSSVCGAALHSGVIDNDGGWLDVTRLGRKQQFTKSYKNGIQSLGYESVCII